MRYWQYTQVITYLRDRYYRGKENRLDTFDLAGTNLILNVFHYPSLANILYFSKYLYCYARNCYIATCSVIIQEIYLITPLPQSQSNKVTSVLSKASDEYIKAKSESLMLILITIRRNRARQSIQTFPASQGMCKPSAAFYYIVFSHIRLSPSAWFSLLL